MQQGEKSTQEETCPLCNTILAQKTYCDCQKLEIHKGECDNYSLLERVVSDEQNMLPSFAPLDETGITEHQGIN